MEKIRHGLGSMRLFKKITLIQGTLTVIAMIVLFSIQYAYLMPIINDYEKILEKSSYDDLCDYMGTLYGDVIGTVENMYGNKTLIQAFRAAAEASRPWDAATTQTMDTFCTNVFRGDNGIHDILFISNGNQVFHRSRSGYRVIRSGHDFGGDSIVSDVRDGKRKQCFYYGNSAEYIVNEKMQMVSFAGVISDVAFPQRSEPIGVFIFNIPFSNIERSMVKSKTYLKGTLSVVNLDDTVIYSTNDAFVGKIYPGISETYDTAQSGVTLGSETVVQTKLFRRPQVRVVNSLQSLRLEQRVNTITLSMVAVLLVIILLFSLLVSIISRVFNQRLRLVMERMHKVSEGDFSARIPVTNHDEIGELGELFNEMCRQLERYIKRVYEAEIEQKNFEVMALQSQINPHFLFNTLESIRMKAVVDGQHELAMMLSALGNLFRRSVKVPGTLISIQDEMEYTASYLELMQFRYDGMLSFSIENDRQLLACGIPKLTLQPIVENALMHGFIDGEGGRITIRGRREEGHIAVEVADDGTGLSAEDLNNLLRQVYAEHIPESPESHYKIGLRNVHRRLAMLFGEEYGLSIYSEAGKGTRVVISLPIIGKEDFF